MFYDIKIQTFTIIVVISYLIFHDIPDYLILSFYNRNIENTILKDIGTYENKIYKLDISKFCFIYKQKFGENLLPVIN
jgi:hypothetical protein